MSFIRLVSTIRGRKGCLSSFGHPSWSGTPFGSSSDTSVPVEAEKQTIKKNRQDVSFDSEDLYTKF